MSASTWAKSVFRVKSNVNGEFTRRTVTVFLACRVFCGAAGALAQPVVKHRVSNVKKSRHLPLTLFDTLFILVCSNGIHSLMWVPTLWATPLDIFI